MSKQLAVASAFSVFAMSALALFAPGAARAPEASDDVAVVELAAPTLSAALPLLD